MIEVGQKLWFVHSRGRNNPCWVVVEKVGRKWALVSGYRPGSRIDISTLQMDGGNYNSPGRCYIDRDEWQANIDQGSAWRELLGRISGNYSPPKGVTTEQIRQMIDMLDGKP